MPSRKNQESFKWTLIRIPFFFRYVHGRFNLLKDTVTVWFLFMIVSRQWQTWRTKSGYNSDRACDLLHDRATNCPATCLSTRILNPILFQPLATSNSVSNSLLMTMPALKIDACPNPKPLFTSSGHLLFFGIHNAAVGSTNETKTVGIVLVSSIKISGISSHVICFTRTSNVQVTAGNWNPHSSRICRNAYPQAGKYKHLCNGDCFLKNRGEQICDIAGDAYRLCSCLAEIEQLAQSVRIEIDARIFHFLSFSARCSLRHLLSGVTWKVSQPSHNRRCQEKKYKLSCMQENVRNWHQSDAWSVFSCLVKSYTIRGIFDVRGTPIH